MPLTIFTVGWLVVFLINKRKWKGVKGIPKKWLVALGICVMLDVLINF